MLSKKFLKKYLNNIISFMILWPALMVAYNYYFCKDFVFASAIIAFYSAIFAGGWALFVYKIASIKNAKAFKKIKN